MSGKKLNRHDVSLKQRNNVAPKNFWDHFRDAKNEFPNLPHVSCRKIANERLLLGSKKMIVQSSGKVKQAQRRRDVDKMGVSKTFVESQRMISEEYLKRGKGRAGRKGNSFQRDVNSMEADVFKKFEKEVVGQYVPGAGINFSSKPVQDMNRKDVIAGKVEKERLAQALVIGVDPVLDADAIAKVAYTWSLYAIANNVLVDKMYMIGPQNVGLYYANAVVIAYDLWLAAQGETTIFGNAPYGYWELRSSITPTTDRGYKYKFVVPETFVGAVTSFYPLGFPMNIDNVSLGWVTNPSVPLFILSNVIPVLNDIDIENSSQAPMSIWTAIAESRGPEAKFWTMMGVPEKTAFTDSSAAFACNLKLQGTFNPLKDYCLFRHEHKINAKEEWLAKLGFTVDDPNTPVPRRLGPGSFSDFVTASNWMDRMVEGITGKVNKRVNRPKFVLLEDILNATLSTMVEADLQFHQKAGVANINQTLFDSVFKFIEQPAFLYGFMVGIVRKFGLRSLLGFDNVEAGMYPCIGTTWLTTGGANIELGLNYMNEMAASMAPVIQSFRGWDMRRDVILVTTGRFSTNIYNGINPLQAWNLISLIDELQPGTTPVNYQFATTNILALPTTVDPLLMTICNVRGTSIPTAEKSMGAMLTALEGNVLVDNIVGNTNTDRTLSYFTRLLTSPEQNDPLWSRYYQSVCTSTLNVYYMPSDCIMYDFTKPLPVSFASKEDYCALYDEHNAIDNNNGELEQLPSIITYAAKINAHPVAGEGYAGSLSEIQAIFQGLGGNFLTDVIGGLAPIASTILGGIFG